MVIVLSRHHVAAVVAAAVVVAVVVVEGASCYDGGGCDGIGLVVGVEVGLLGVGKVASWGLVSPFRRCS